MVNESPRLFYLEDEAAIIKKKIVGKLKIDLKESSGILIFYRGKVAQITLPRVKFHKFFSFFGYSPEKIIGVIDEAFINLTKYGEKVK